MTKVMATPKMSFKEFIGKNLIKTLKEESVSSLGDRSKYIGASDIGGCPFKTIKSKLEASEHEVSKHIVFQRGHNAEEIAAKMLKGTNYERQVCLEADINGFPIKAHLDYLISSKNRRIVVEVKTVSAPISEPYESWIMQVNTQMGLLISDLQDEDIMVEGKVIVIDVNSGWYDTFDFEFDDAIFEVCLGKAEHLADCLQNGAEPKAIIQNYCGTCPFIMECPKQGKHAAELPEDLAQSLAKIKEFKKLEKEISLLEKQLKEYLVNTGTEAVKIDGEMQAVAKCKESQSNRFDTTRFKAEHPEMYEEYVKTSSSFRMTIS